MLKLKKTFIVIQIDKAYSFYSVSKFGIIKEMLRIINNGLLKYLSYINMKSELFSTQTLKFYPLKLILVNDVTMRLKITKESVRAVKDEINSN